MLNNDVFTKAWGVLTKITLTPQLVVLFCSVKNIKFQH